MSTWLTVTQIARRLGRRESVIRSWRDRHASWVPSRQDEDGRQTYPLERLEQIAVMYAERLTPREVDAELERRHASGAEPVPSDRLGQVIEQLERIERKVDWLIDRERQREA